jgi:hypothetical protein
MSVSLPITQAHGRAVQRASALRGSTRIVAIRNTGRAGAWTVLMDNSWLPGVAEGYPTATKERAAARASSNWSSRNALAGMTKSSWGSLPINQVCATPGASKRFMICRIS